tara:strand:- start:314 stop:658 length:345 start_codon:yes stop_codon:yes gene_type:complete
MSNFREVKNAPIKHYIVACSGERRNPIYKKLKEEKEELCDLRKIEEEQNGKKEEIIEKEKIVNRLEKQANHPKLRLMFWVNDAILRGYVPYGDLIITDDGNFFLYSQALVLYAY